MKLYRGISQNNLEPILILTNKFGKKLIYSFSQAQKDFSNNKIRPWLQLSSKAPSKHSG